MGLTSEEVSCGTWTWPGELYSNNVQPQTTLRVEAPIQESSSRRDDPLQAPGRKERAALGDDGEKNTTPQAFVRRHPHSQMQLRWSWEWGDVPKVAGFASNLGLNDQDPFGMKKPCAMHCTELWLRRRLAQGTITSR